MAKMLINGVLTEKTKSTNGVFNRQSSQFRNWLSQDDSSAFKVEPDRYALYVSKACPWCHRTTIMHALKGIEKIIPLINMEAIMAEQGWEINISDLEKQPPLPKVRYLYEMYLRADRHYTGAITAPLLWDNKTQTIVSNESADIMRMFNFEFSTLKPLHNEDMHLFNIDFYPKALQGHIDELNDFIYQNISNGIYQVGFAQTQTAYDDAVHTLFSALDKMEQQLQGQKYLLGEDITEADWRLFVSLIRFDAVYFQHFKASKKRISDYPNLNFYTNSLYNLPGIADTVDVNHIKQHYFLSHKHLNPSGIIPVCTAETLTQFTRHQNIQGQHQVKS